MVYLASRLKKAEPDCKPPVEYVMDRLYTGSFQFLDNDNQL